MPEIGPRDTAAHCGLERLYGEVAARLGHELRTPLNAILGYAQLLAGSALSPEQQDYLRQILVAARHLSRLVDEAVDLYRAQHGSVTTDGGSASVTDSLRDATSMVAPMACARGVRLEVTQISADWRIRTHPHHLRQVLINLLTNAVKHSPPGGVVCVTGTPAGADRLRLAVTDAGPGVPPALCGRLFTTDAARRIGPTVDGMGLGLTIVKQLVDAMGGQIGVTSQPGGGSTFWVELPLDPAPPSGAG